MMSSTSLANLKTSLTVPMVVTSEEFRFLWRTFRFWRRIDSMSPEIFAYCDKEVVRKLLQEDNPFLENVLHRSLEGIMAYLKEEDKSFQLGAYLSKDIEIPEWEGISILVNVDYETIEEKMELWERIEGEIKGIVDRLRREHTSHINEIKRANELISTRVQRTR